MTDTQGPRVPRRSAQVVQSSLRAHHASRRARAYRRAVLGLLFLVLTVWGANALMVGRPVRAALAADTAAARLQLRARFQYYLDLTTLVLDLGSVDAAAPMALAATATLPKVFSGVASGFRRSSTSVLRSR